MPQRRKSAAETLLADNSRRLSRADLLERVKQEQEAAGVAPHIQGGRPRCPADFSELEVSCFKAACRILKQRGTLSKGDSESLEMWARTKARYIRCSMAVADEGEVVEETRFSKSGDEYTIKVKNPNLTIVEQCERALQAMAKSLGLTVADRSKVKATRGTAAAKRDDKWTPTPGTYGEYFREMFNDKGQLKKEKPC